MNVDVVVAYFNVSKNFHMETKGKLQKSLSKYLWVKIQSCGLQNMMYKCQPLLHSVRS